MAPAVFPLRFNAPFPCCGHNVLIFALDAEGPGPAMARPSQWPSLPALQGPRPVPMVGLAGHRRALPAADSATMSVFLHLFPLRLVPWANFPGSVLGPKLGMTPWLWAARLRLPGQPWPGRAEHVALPHEPWRGHGPSTGEPGEEPWWGLNVPLAGQGPALFSV